MELNADRHSQRTRHGQWMNPASQPDLASIIIPTFNRASLLGEAISSAAGQIYRPLEIIVVDDGSIDNTGDLVRQWQEKIKGDSHACIRYFHQPNSGVGSARNRGLIESRGEFIQFLDSDDLLDSQKLSLQIECLRSHPQCGYVFSDRVRADNPNERMQISVADATVADSANYYCGRGVMLTMVGVYRRATCCQAGPFAEDMNLGEDEEYNLRALLATARVIYLPGNLCALRHHSGPRLTDVHGGRTGLVHSMNMYRRMIASAAAIGRLNDPRLVSALARCLTNNTISAFKIGCPDLGNDAIDLCRTLPITATRRLRLAMYAIFGLLPSGTFPRLWPVWLKLRHAVFEIPTRRISRLRNE